METLVCGGCGASGVERTRSGLVRCSYCKAVTMADPLPPDELDQLRENLSRSTRKIEPLLSKKANYWNGGLAEGGKLHVTKGELVFVPHA